ncbi:MAG TPA: amidohydrolase [Dehalococcoidia bacterium]|nr:amidohydrolase [Dehalococcoidia bacterium]
MDLLIENARIWTGDVAAPWAEAALVREGVFAFVGRRGDTKPPAGAERIDAGGRLMLPGFVDGHAHLYGTGMALASVGLRDTKDEADAARRVHERVLGGAAGAWVYGAGWDQNDWPDARFPTRASLDAIAPETPVLLTHVSAHCVWANSAALRAAGVTRETPDPAGGSIDRDADGEPTGVLRDNAMELVQRASPPASAEQRRAYLRSAIAHAHGLGVTAVHAMDVGRGEWAALQALHADGELSLRVRAFLSARRLDAWIAEGARSGDGDEMLRIGGVKFFADGALGSMTAWMREPYEGTHDTGIALQTAEELGERVERSLRAGLAPAIHAIGDRANSEVLDTLERLREVARELPRRIEHAQLLNARDVPRFAALGVTASVQPVHATQDMRVADRAWGKRCATAYAYRSLVESGANVAFGSDTPVETMDPIAGIHAAVTRRAADGEPAGGWHPEQRVSLDAAIAAYTRGCAAAVGEEPRAGRIARGQQADFVLLSDDLFTLEDPMRMLDVRVEVTAVGGRVVFGHLEV